MTLSLIGIKGLIITTKYCMYICFETWKTIKLYMYDDLIWKSINKSKWFLWIFCDFFLSPKMLNFWAGLRIRVKSFNVIMSIKAEPKAKPIYRFSAAIRRISTGYPAANRIWICLQRFLLFKLWKIDYL